MASSSSATGGNRQGQCGWTSVEKAATKTATKAAATVTATVADVAGQAAANAARARIVGKKRRLAVQVVGSGTAGAGPATERVSTERHVNLMNANLAGETGGFSTFGRGMQFPVSGSRGVTKHFLLVLVKNKIGSEACGLSRPREGRSAGFRSI